MTAEQQIRDLFDRFVSIHPNTREPFVATLENLQRWQWSITEHEKRHTGDETVFGVADKRSATAFAKSRSVTTFARLPTSTREKFLTLASLFPGRKVFAVGSRINGEFIDKDSPKKVTQMRIDLLKKKTEQSDFDITFDMVPNENLDDIKSLLPSWGDYVVNVPKNESKIEIPMWDFSKLPPHRFNEIIELVGAKQWGKLMSIHNEFSLSDTFFCCDSKPAERWFKWAIENKIIQPITNQTPPAQ
jgi:hypothetical protein